MGPDPVSSLLAVSVAAFVVPFLFGLYPRTPLPTIVGEVLVGVALGGSWLGWIGGGDFVEFLFLFGLAFLLFLAGFEIDFVLLARSLVPGDIGSSPLVLGTIGFGLRIALALGIAHGLAWQGLVVHPTLVAVLLVSTSLGIVLSVLKGDGSSTTPFGQAMLVSTAIADLGTVVLLTALFSAEGRAPSSQLLLVAVMVGTAVLLFGSLRLAGRVPQLTANVERLSSATSQIRVRGSLALLVVFVALAAELGLELILGAFMAGAVVSALTTGTARHELGEKLDAVGYGFFVPVFFVLAGARVDMPTLLADEQALMLVPVLAVAAVAVKLPAALVFCRVFGIRTSIAAGFLQSAQLTLTIAGVEIGERLGLLEPAIGAALIMVALVTVLAAPLCYSVTRGSQSPVGTT